MSPLAFLAATAILLTGQTEHFVTYDAAQPDRKLAVTRLTDADIDFDYQGEYMGQVRAVDGTPVVFGLQVVALGNGQFSAKGYQDGLPGNGWDHETTIAWSGTRQDDLLTFDGPRGRIVIEGGAGLVIDASGNAVGQVTKIRRVSTTMGAAPPPGATVLFDGTGTDAFEDGKLTQEGWLDVGALTKTKVNDFRLHLEFRLPYMPYARSQGRANSGVYIQRRYEVQILDSFGLEPVFNGCAALYRQRVPSLNMSFPPLAWQTYDIFFTAARWDDTGDKISDARITVYHNGIAVHQDQVVTAKTGAGKQESPEPGPILLQNHGNPVRFRNVWLRVDPPEIAHETANIAPGTKSAEDAIEAIEPSEPLATAYGDPDAIGSARYEQDTLDAIAPEPTPYNMDGYNMDGYGGGPTGGRCANGPSYQGWILWRGRYPN